MTSVARDEKDARDCAGALAGLRWHTGAGWHRWDGAAWVLVDKEAVREVIAGYLGGRATGGRLTRVEHGCRDLLRYTPPQWREVAP